LPLVSPTSVIISQETGEEVKSKPEQAIASSQHHLSSKTASCLAHAVQIAQPFQAMIIIMYLDNLIQQDNLSHFLQQFRQTQLDALILLRQVAIPVPLALPKSMNTGAY